MASNLTDQVRSISEITKAVALGDLGKLVNVDVHGEMLGFKVGISFDNLPEYGFYRPLINSR